MTWLVMLAVGAGSYVFRVGPLFLLQRIAPSERASRLIRNAGTAVITALIVVAAKGNATGTATVPTLLAMAVAVVLAARGASMMRLLAGGGSAYVLTMVISSLISS
jgi:branched-subunit amino acid transport protein